MIPSGCFLAMLLAHVLCGLEFASTYHKQSDSTPWHLLADILSSGAYMRTVILLAVIKSVQYLASQRSNRHHVNFVSLAQVVGASHLAFVLCS